MTTWKGDFDRPGAAVPDPHLRDQLVQVLIDQPVLSGNHTVPITPRDAHLLADALLPLIEARVQAAANQRAAEELRSIARAALTLSEIEQGAQPVRVPVSYLFDRAAALAQPAPTEATT